MKRIFYFFIVACMIMASCDRNDNVEPQPTPPEEEEVDGGSESENRVHPTIDNLDDVTQLYGTWTAKMAYHSGDWFPLISVVELTLNSDGTFVYDMDDAHADGTYRYANRKITCITDEVSTIKADSLVFKVYAHDSMYMRFKYEKCKSGIVIYYDLLVQKTANP